MQSKSIELTPVSLSLSLSPNLSPRSSAIRVVETAALPSPSCAPSRFTHLSFGPLNLKMTDDFNLYEDLDTSPDLNKLVSGVRFPALVSV